jgi:hypothetical protein
VKTANATVAMIKPSELLNFSINGGLEPRVNDNSHCGRGMVSNFLFLQYLAEG